MFFPLSQQCYFTTSCNNANLDRRLVNRANIAQQTAEEARARELLPPRLANRARREMGHTSYSIVPRSTVVQDNKFARPVGASGEDRFRRMKARQLNAGKPSHR